MQIRRAQRTHTKIRLAIQGPSGSGKTYSALLLSLGLTDDMSKVCVIDTEHGSADLYSHLGDYSVINPISHTPEDYMKAMEVAEMEGMEVLVVDSLSHAWEYLIEHHGQMTGNSFANWSKITPRHRGLIYKILGSKCHVIATLRVKQDYVLSDRNGKMVPEKVGLKAVQRDGVDYEFTTVFDLSMNHHATCSKDRTGLFIDQPEFLISQDTGKKILDWCNQGSESRTEKLRERIRGCKSMKELMRLYKEDVSLSKAVQSTFTVRKEALTVEFSNPIDPSTNGSQ